MLVAEDERHDQQQDGGREREEAPDVQRPGALGTINRQVLAVKQAGGRGRSGR